MNAADSDFCEVIDCKACPHCGGPTWTCTPSGYFGPVGSLLYAYASLLRPDDRYAFSRRHTSSDEVWCCDKCRKAGLR